MDKPFWIIKSLVAIEQTSRWTETENTNVFTSAKRTPSNQCISRFWMNKELCTALRPIANEWSHDDCNQEKFFICERSPDNGKFTVVAQR